MSKLFKLKKLKLDSDTVKSISLKPTTSSTSLKILNNSTNKNGVGISGRGTIKGGKIFNSTSGVGEQKVIVIAKSSQSGYDKKTGTVARTNKQNGALANGHLDYINREEAANQELEKNMSDFNDNDLYLLSKKEENHISKEELDKQISKDLKNGKIEGNLIILDTEENRNKLKSNKDLKVIKSTDQTTGEDNLIVFGKIKDLKKIDEIATNEFKTNIYNKKGNVSYEELNLLKKRNLDKGVPFNLRLEISPKDQVSKEDLIKIVEDTLLKFEASSGKKLDYNFAIHTNTDHIHAHIDIAGDKNLKFSKEELQLFKTITTEKIVNQEENNKNNKELKSIEKNEAKHLNTDYLEREQALKNIKVLSLDEKIEKFIKVNNGYGLIKMLEKEDVEINTKILNKTEDIEFKKSIVMNAKLKTKTLIDLSNDSDVKNEATDRLVYIIKIKENEEKDFSDYAKRTTNEEVLKAIATNYKAPKETMIAVLNNYHFNSNPKNLEKLIANTQDGEIREIAKNILEIREDIERNKRWEKEDERKGIKQEVKQEVKRNQGMEM